MNDLELYYQQMQEMHRRAFEEAWARFMEEIRPIATDEILQELKKIKHQAEIEDSRRE